VVYLLRLVYRRTLKGNTISGVVTSLLDASKETVAEAKAERKLSICSSLIIKTQGKMII
jgi:hypothetical protein